MSEHKTGVFYFSLPAEPGTQMLDIEDLYQAFKQRLMAELVAKGGFIFDTAEGKSVPQVFELVERSSSQKGE